jgi:hypothetical protein
MILSAVSDRKNAQRLAALTDLAFLVHKKSL